MKKNPASTSEFKAILKELYRQGYAPSDALKAAWEEYRRRHGFAPKRTVQEKRYAYRKSFENPNFTRMQLQKYFEAIPGTVRARINAVEKAFDIYDIKVTDAPGKRLEIVSWKLKEIKKNSRAQRAMDNVVKGAAFGIGSAIAGKILPNRPPAGARAGRRKNKKNPIAIYNGRETTIYNQAIELRAKGRVGDNPSTRYRHTFSPSSKVKVIGLPNGDVVLKSVNGKRLWEP